MKCLYLGIDRYYLHKHNEQLSTTTVQKRIVEPHPLEDAKVTSTKVHRTSFSLLVQNYQYYNDEIVSTHRRVQQDEQI